ncbi:Hsp20/alpha crystallin family protein [Spirochaetota bacterium]
MLSLNLINDALRLWDVTDGFFDTDYRMYRKFPYVEFYEGNDEIEIRAQVPGVKTEDLNIHLIENSLVLEGEKKFNETEDKYIKRERHFGKFKKSIKLPYRVNSKKIHADLKNGILTVKLYKSEDAKPKKIEIK